MVLIEVVMIYTDINSLYPNIMSYIPQKFFKIAEAEVDGAMWYTLFIEPEVMMWLKSINSSQWVYEPGGSWRLYVDVHEQLYSALVLRWG